MRRVYLVATAGYPNFGDEAIVRVWLRWLARHHPHDEVWLDCPFPGSAAALFHRDHPRLRCVDTLFEMLRGAPDAWGAAEQVMRSVESPGLAPTRIHGLRVLAEADVVHVVGGGYINALWPTHLGLLAAVAAVGQRSGARTALTGAGLSPPPEHCEVLLSRYAQNFHVLDARDAASAALLGCSTTGDDLLLDLSSATGGPAPEGADVFVVAQGDLHSNTPALAEAVLQCLRKWDVRDNQVAFVECIPRVDRRVFDLLQPLMPGCHFVPFVDVWDLGLPALPGQRWISTRFHPHLLASAAGAKGVYVCVQPDYYATKHESLCALGSGWRGAELGQLLPEAGSPGSFPEEAKRVRGLKETLAADIYGEGERAVQFEGRAGHGFGRRR